MSENFLNELFYMGKEKYRCVHLLSKMSWCLLFIHNHLNLNTTNPTLQHTNETHVFDTCAHLRNDMVRHGTFANHPRMKQYCNVATFSDSVVCAVFSLEALQGYHWIKCGASPAYPTLACYMPNMEYIFSCWRNVMGVPQCFLNTHPLT